MKHSLFEQAWVCRPEYLQSFSRFAKTISQETIEIIEVEISAGKRLSPISRTEKEVGHLYIKGTLTPNVDPFALLFGDGNTSYQQIQQEVAKLSADDSIKTVYMHINSPGGTVEGVDNTWQALRSLAENKTLIAINEGEIASGAYWLASAAHKIYSVSETNEQGSVGVLSGYVDWTQYDKNKGIEEKIFTSKNAKLKHPNAEGAQPGYDKALQNTLDDLEDIFVDRISQGRGLTVDHIHKKFGKGGMLLGKDAVASKMIDGVANLQDIYSKANDTSGDAVSVKTNNNKENNEVDLKELLENPLVKAEMDRRVAEADKAGYDRGRKEHVQEVEKALVFVSSEKYNDKVKAFAIDVCKGVKSIESLEMVVDLFDVETAKKEVKDAQETIDDVTEGEPVVSKQPKVTEFNERTIEERVKAMKGETN
jgi:signal peptide peptidase SppA